MPLLFSDLLTLPTYRDAVTRNLRYAIVGGDRDPEAFAAFRDVRCKSSMDTIKAALVGNDREEHVFALTQSLKLYDFYKAQIAACDCRLEAAVAALTVRAEGDLAPLPKARIKRQAAQRAVLRCAGRALRVFGRGPDADPRAWAIAGPAACG